jgi:hypothetical protein
LDDARMDDDYDDVPRRLTWREALQYVVDGRAQLDRAELEAVAIARRQGVHWWEIAAELGVTKQSAHRRFARRDEVSRR